MVIAVGSYPTRLRPFAGSSPATDTNAGMAKFGSTRRAQTSESKDIYGFDSRFSHHFVFYRVFPVFFYAGVAQLVAQLIRNQ